MKNLEEIKTALNAIRSTLDVDVVDMGIESTYNKLIALTQLMGLSAECNASAKKLLGIKELEVFMTMNKNMPPSIQSKLLKAHCNEQEAVLEYADRLNASIVHCCDSLRSVISLYKTEMQITDYQSKLTK